MSVKRFKFVSPGVFVNEIDNSQLPASPTQLGPVVIGRTERGPSMRPVTVGSQAEFIEMFGYPIPGGKSNDVWREGNYQSPTYASYAAMAYLRNNGPVTVVRLLGHQHGTPATAGQAGWQVASGAYGLFLYDSGAMETQATGTLAAIFYCDDAAVVLSGAAHSNAAAQVSGAAQAIVSVGSDREFRALVYNDANSPNTVSKDITFNFNKNSDRYIRKVFNTNPSLTAADSSIGSNNAQTYWLGQTFEDSLADYMYLGSTAGDTVGIMLQLTDGAKNHKNFKFAAQNATTGWVLSQQLDNDTGSFAPKTQGGVSRLFYLESLDCGEWESSNLKVTIEDIRYSRTEDENPYGTFTVSVRRREDNDSAPKYVERFTNCNLNPMSPNYVKRKVGDQKLEWDEGERRYKIVGDYPNMSRYVTVQVDPDMDNGALEPQLLPFGFEGPQRLKPIISLGADGGSSQGALEGASGATVMSELSGIFSQAGAALTSYAFGTGPIRLEFPEARLRVSSDDGALPNRKRASWGVNTSASGSNKATNRCWPDLMFPLPDAVGDTYTEMSWAFSLDDVTLSTDTSTWAEGNRLAGTSYSALNSWQDTLNQGIDRFTMPLWGGFDGLDIRTLDPFASDLQIESTATDKSSYEYYSVKKAIDACSDPEVVECNLMVVPGCTHTGVNQHLVNVCEDRADALAILDIAGGYKPRSNRTTSESTFSSYGGSVDTTLNQLNDLSINSSYACTYYPWVQVRDTTNAAVVWVPPSVVALGTMGSSEARTEVWFAPAGFTRGGLSEGSAGLPVVNVRDRLTSKQRDQLYQQNVNPIATFPAEGIVIFGQKTMQVTPSALDRINVRRLMVFVKKEISRMAATTLFDQNVQRTWNRFLGRVNPFLRSVQARMGLADFKVILDETTTTPELIDRNIMYAKILLKPARAIEFIAIDFVITDSGASFED